jgi:hypothetical protein
MHDITRFSLGDMVRMSAALRVLGEGARSMEEVAGRIVRELYDDLGDPRTSRRSTALVRFYVTHAFGALDEGRQRFAASLCEGARPDPGTRCLTLLATAGDEPAWNSVAGSAGHQAIPLLGPEMVARLPMVAQLLAQLGVDLGALLTPNPGLMADANRSFNVFHVPEALGSPYVPAQRDFVERHGIRSVLGFGGMLPTGDIFAIILFSKVFIADATRELFKSLALGAKVAVVPFAATRVLASASEGGVT